MSLALKIWILRKAKERCALRTSNIMPLWQTLERSNKANVEREYLSRINRDHSIERRIKTFYRYSIKRL